ncbi:hypothetical protein [Brachybacterium sp.]|uniref:hypothetical protein n=1 Tax=Brachybacterium sp. TaxID=1891286 RepID=UPI002ED1FF35
MTQTPPPPRSPMEQQGELLQDLAGVLLASLELPEDWARLGAAFLPHGDRWAGRFVISTRGGAGCGDDAGGDAEAGSAAGAARAAAESAVADGAARGGDAVFGPESRVTALLDALQQVTAEQSQACVSCRLQITRTSAEPGRIAVSGDLNYDRDPGSFDGVGGVDADYARRLAVRVGTDRLPGWVRDLLPAS